MGRRVHDSVGTRGPESCSGVSCLEGGQDGFRMGIWVLPGGRGVGAVALGWRLSLGTLWP